MKFWKPKSLRLCISGWVFAIIAFLVQLAAWNTGENLLYIIAGGLLSFLAVAFVLSMRTLTKLKVYRSAPESVHRAEPFAITLRIENHKRLLPALSLRINAGSRQDVHDGYIVKVPAQRTALLRISHTFERRGVHVLPPVLVQSGFPFGLVERRATFPAPAEVVVYPHVRPIRATALEQLYGGGETPRLLRGESDEFFCLREYSPGDDMRRISWKISARLQKLVVREMEPSTSHNVLVGFDTINPGGIENFEQIFEDTVDLVASLAVSLLNRQYSVGIATPETMLELGEGAGQVRRILNMLARVEPAAPEDHVPDWFDRYEYSGAMAYAYVSTDPARWGSRIGPSRTRVLDPTDIVHA